LNASSDFTSLRRLLVQRKYAEFLDGYESAYEGASPHTQPALRALAGEGLIQSLCEEPASLPAITARFIRLLATALVDLPADFSAMLEDRLKIPEVVTGTAQAEQMPTEPVRPGPEVPPTATTHKPPETSCRPIIRTRRVIQITDYQWGSYSVSDALGLRQSVFRSKQERTFLRALSLRFPGLTALPNYPLDQIADFEKLQAVLDPAAIRFGRKCRLDALLVIPDEGDPVAAFELDSHHHDSGDAQWRDQMKDRLLQVVGIPLFRLRAEENATMDTDEWYALLTDQVWEQVTCGERIRSRRFHSSLVPATGA
jgi:hypothetical protein